MNRFADFRHQFCARRRLQNLTTARWRPWLHQGFPACYHATLTKYRGIFAAELPPGPGGPRRIIDATGNVGCDTLLFRHLYPTAVIDVIELDAATFACLQRNTREQVVRRVLALRGGTMSDGDEHITAHHASCVSVLAAMACTGDVADLVYFDPPWGGPDYQQKATLVLRLDAEPVSAIAGRALRDVAPFVVLKAPVNADADELLAGIAVELGGAPEVTCHDVHKPAYNAKGSVAYRLWFFRRPPALGGDAAPAVTGCEDLDAC